MAVELDHSFTTARPIDESFATILDLERVVPCVEGGSVLERTGPDVGQGRDQGQDGRDVDDVHRHRRDRRAGRRRPPRGDERQVAEAGGQGYANATVAFALTRRRRDDPHQRPDHRQGRVDGRGRRGRRARRADHGLQPASSARSEGAPMATIVDARRSAPGEVPRDGGTAIQEDPDRPGVPRQRARRLRLRRVRQRAGRRRWTPAQMTKQGARALRPLQDGQRRDHRRAGRRRLRGSAARAAAASAVAVRGGRRPRRRRPAAATRTTRRMAHRGRRQVEQRVVVRPLALHAAEAEALGRQAAREPVAGRAPARGTARWYSSRSNAERRVGRVEVERGQPERGEVRAARRPRSPCRSARARGRPAGAGSRAPRAAPTRRP